MQLILQNSVIKSVYLLLKFRESKKKQHKVNILSEKEEKIKIKEEALQLYSSGLTSQEVSNALNNKVSARTVRRYVFIAGISRSPGARRLGVYDGEQVCNKCKIRKSLDLFGVDNSCMNKHKGICRECESKINRMYYSKNKIELIKIKGNVCEVCNKQFDWWVYDFHHVDSSIKETKMSQLYKTRNMNLEKVLEELDKCILVCANCHRDIHYKQEGGE